MTHVVKHDFSTSPQNRPELRKLVRAFQDATLRKAGGQIMMSEEAANRAGSYANPIVSLDSLSPEIGRTLIATHMVLLGHSAVPIRAMLESIDVSYLTALGQMIKNADVGGPGYKEHDPQEIADMVTEKANAVIAQTLSACIPG